MKKSILKNSILQLLIFFAYFFYRYMAKLASVKLMQPLLIAGITVSCILVGFSIYFMDFSFRACNVIFLLVNLVSHSLFYVVFYQNDVLLYVSVVLSALFLVGVIVPKKGINM